MSEEEIAKFNATINTEFAEDEVDATMVADALDSYFKYMTRNDQRRDRRIKWLLSIVSPDLAEAIQEDVDEGGIESVTITKVKPHPSYLEHGSELGRHVEQHSGCCEDDYYGNIWYPLNDKHYVKMEFRL